MANSRTSRSIKNSTVALCFFLLDFVLKFFSRSIFLKILGNEVLGLNSTIMNLLQFLNLAELGIGAAVGFSLYIPILEKDNNTINEIIQLNGYLYKKIAGLICIGAIILMFFFPVIFNKISLPLWYPYATFITFLIGIILTYCINYKQILLSAAQLDYKILYSYRSTQIFKVIVQIVAVKFLSYPYIWWLLIEGLFAIISSILLDYTVKKTFPFIKNVKHSYVNLKTKYSVILQKIKQVFFHKISGFVLTQTSPIIIYAYLSLSVVTYYTNYVIITTGILQLFNAVFNSMANSVGNLVAEGNHSNIMKVFSEVFSLRFFITSICCFGIIILIKPFISLWIGSQYLLPDSTLYIIVGTLYLTLTRTTVDAFLNAYGMYQDIIAPIIEAAINISFSLLLGYYWGLNGILSGSLISLILVVFIWKPYFLFQYGFHESIICYLRLYIKHIFILGVSVLIWYSISLLFSKIMIEDTTYLLLRGICNVIIFILIFGIFLISAKAPLLITLKRFL